MRRSGPRPRTPRSTLRARAQRQRAHGRPHRTKRPHLRATGWLRLQRSGIVDFVKRVVPIALVLAAVALGVIYLRDRAQDNPFAHEGKEPTSEQIHEIHAAA